ncbi:Phosphoglycerate kinase [Chlamydiales bacterium STE3]|nr:Phosphoglycerate kinase [Chlamydiales bacterium STE3]
MPYCCCSKKRFMKKKLSVKELGLKGKKVLLRVDFNVPLDENGKVIDNTRILASLPTIRYILEQGGAVILLSHVGRPKGKREAKLSLAPCAHELAKLLATPVIMAPDCVGEEVKKLAKNLKPQDILMLENLRFYPAEEKPETDLSFARNLAMLGDYYVEDAFGTVHRAHSSTFNLPQLFPDRAAAGFLLEKEVDFLGSLLQSPKKPFTALIGGAKISTKIGVLHSLLKRVDSLMIGGGMAFTFLKAQGLEIGKSLYEEEFLKEAETIMRFAKEKNVPLLLPQDVIAVKEIKDNAKIQIVSTIQGIPQNLMAVDIGPQTIQSFSKLIFKAATILWNGPMGIFEISLFANGTLEMAKAIADSGALSVVGGGETIAAIKQSQLEKAITHLSTGGGATLEFLEKGTLPGIEALTSVP